MKRKEDSDQALLSAIYALYLDSKSALIYLGSREYAQDLVDGMITASNGLLSPLSFTLEEIITVDGIVVLQQSIDI